MENVETGYEIRLLSMTPDHRLVLNCDELELILMQPLYKDKKMVIVSVAGAYRRGKSFILNYFLRYLNNHGNRTNVLGASDAPLEGFQWRGGFRRVTHGINIWSQPILHNLSNGEQVVVLLMDTEGTQDLKNNMKTDIRIFALSLVLSSLQIYSLSSQFTTSDFEYLRLFTDFAKMLLRETNGLQSLLFLIRDWDFPNICPFGFDGGQRMFEETFEESNLHEADSNTEASFLRKNFTEVRTFLMPHPGPQIGKSSFTGCLDQLDDVFVDNLKHLCSALFDSEVMTVKRLFNNVLTCENFAIWLKQCTQLFQTMDPPTQNSVYETIVTGKLEEAMQESVELYKKSMDEELAKQAEFVDISQLKIAHTTAFKKAVDSFEELTYFGAPVNHQHCRDKLDAAINRLYQKKEENFLKKLDANKKIRTAMELDKLVNAFITSVTEMTYSCAIALKTKEEFVEKFKELAEELELRMGETLGQSGKWATDQMKHKFEDEMDKELKLAITQFERIKAVTDEQIIWKCLALYENEMTQLLERARESNSQLCFPKEHSLVLDKVLEEFQNLLPSDNELHTDMKNKLLKHIAPRKTSYEDQFCWINTAYFANINDTKIDELIHIYDDRIKKQGKMNLAGLDTCHKACVQIFHQQLANEIKGDEGQRFMCMVNFHKRLIKRYYHFGRSVDSKVNWNKKVALMQSWQEEIFFPGHPGVLDDFHHVDENVVNIAYHKAKVRSRMNRVKDCAIV